MLQRRSIEKRYLETVASRRVTVVTGPRQSGKTTLVGGLLPDTGGVMRNLDEPGILAAALADPAGFIASTSSSLSTSAPSASAASTSASTSTDPEPLVIDEIQRGGEPLVRAIKAQVDRDPSPGQFVLTGSSNFLTVPTISESLTGRAGFVEVWPFSQGELADRTDRFVDLVFSEGVTALANRQPGGIDREDLLERVCAGGYPEVHALGQRTGSTTASVARHRARWFADYVRTTIERDVVEMSGIRKVTETGQLLRLLAARSGGELVMQNLIADSALERQAVYDHRAWLQTIHLVATLPAWSRNLTRRVKRRPKVFITDPGLAAWLTGKTAAGLADPTDPATGRLVETFVYAELRRQLTWADTEASMYHWQDRSGARVDFVLESSDGRVLALEVKTGQTPKPEWFRWLTRMRDAIGERFVGGVALYGGRDTLPFGERLLAVPISALWGV
jgi:uncharacterized protein